MSGLWHDACVDAALTFAAALINTQSAYTWPMCAAMKAGVYPALAGWFRSALQSASSCRHSVWPLNADIRSNIINMVIQTVYQLN